MYIEKVISILLYGSIYMSLSHITHIESIKRQKIPERLVKIFCLELILYVMFRNFSSRHLQKTLFKQTKLLLSLPEVSTKLNSTNPGMSHTV